MDSRSDTSAPAPRRILVGGISGSGKTTLARRLAARLDLPFVEMDALFHGENWTPRPSFADDVEQVLAGDRWVIDSFGYPEVLERCWERADTIVWLDYPRRVVMPRVLSRTLRRWLLREVLWNGNRERARSWFDAEHPIRWAWSWYGERRTRREQAWCDPRWQHLDLIRVRHPDQAEAWFARLPTAPGYAGDRPR